MAKVTVVTVRNPFDLNSREVKELPYVPGEPVYHYIYSTLFIGSFESDGQLVGFLNKR